jgi:Tat protein secretion system quality control protein TatD with DNase activity
MIGTRRREALQAIHQLYYGQNSFVSFAEGRPASHHAAVDDVSESEVLTETDAVE